MVIRKNFKDISENKTLNENSQVEISVSLEEIAKVQSVISDFFLSVKTLLREGAVLIGENESKDLEEEFLENPYLTNKQKSLYFLALKALPKEKADEFIKKIQGVKMDENYNFEFEMNKEFKLKKDLEKIISTEIKSYANELPVIMQERTEKLKALIEARPDIKKYLENTKK